MSLLDRFRHGFSKWLQEEIHDQFCVCGMYEPISEVEDDEDFDGPYSSSN